MAAGEIPQSAMRAQVPDRDPGVVVAAVALLNGEQALVGRERGVAELDIRIAQAREHPPALPGPVSKLAHLPAVLPTANGQQPPTGSPPGDMAAGIVDATP